MRFTAAGVLCRLGSCDEALPVLAQGLLDSREAGRAARRPHAAKPRRQGSPRSSARWSRPASKCKNLDGSYENDNYAMFIDWALNTRMENCKKNEP